MSLDGPDAGRRDRQQRRLPAPVLPAARRAGPGDRAGPQRRAGRPRNAGFRRSTEFFGDELAANCSREGRRADVIHANNVLAHVPDLNGVVRGIGAAAQDDGVAVIETPYVRDLVERAEFDTIYHEHLCYFSLTALEALFRRHGLVDPGRRAPGDPRRVAAPVRRQVGQLPRRLVPAPCWTRSARSAWAELDYYRDLGGQGGHGQAAAARPARGSDRARPARRGVRRRREGRDAPELLRARAPDVIEYVVDRSEPQAGTVHAGRPAAESDPPTLLDGAPPDYLLILAWNLADEIMRQQAAYRAQGGRFIVPVPKPRVLEEPTGS